jgi:hypothetical protein
MPWDMKATKDVACLRKVSVRWLATYDPGMSEWGNLICRNADCPAPYGAGSEPAEVKHLSKRRKRERMFIPLVAASEKGGA